EGEFARGKSARPVQRSTGSGAPGPVPMGHPDDPLSGSPLWSFAAPPAPDAHPLGLTTKEPRVLRRHAQTVGRPASERRQPATLGHPSRRSFVATLTC